MYASAAHIEACPGMVPPEDIELPVQVPNVVTVPHGARQTGIPTASAVPNDKGVPASKGSQNGKVRNGAKRTSSVDFVTPGKKEGSRPRPVNFDSDDDFVVEPPKCPVLHFKRKGVKIREEVKLKRQI